LLLTIALVANPLVGMASVVHASSPVASESPPCHEMGMAAGKVSPPPCHEHGCPESDCGSACAMGACVGHCVFLVDAVALPIRHGSDARLPFQAARDAMPPLLALPIRPPIA
jgi:hypothetical protein